MSVEGRNPTVIMQKNGKVVLEDRAMPQTQKGQLIIKTRRTLISTGTELTILSGEFSPDSFWASIASNLPGPTGYCNIGEVIDIGKNVAQGWIGRTVAVLGGGYHARYILGTPDKCYPVPKNVPDDQATFFALARTVMNSVRRGRVQWGEAVAIYGLGILGQLALRFCHIAGARPVIGIDISESRFKYLPDLVGISSINPNGEKVADRIRELTRSRLVDVVFEATGNPSVIPGELEILKRQGRFVVLSSPRGKTSFDFHDLCNWPSYTIIGTHDSSHPQVAIGDNPWTKNRHIEFFFDLVGNGELDIESLISHRVNYQEAPEMYEMLLTDRSGAMGVVLKW